MGETLRFFFFDFFFFNLPVTLSFYLVKAWKAMDANDAGSKWGYNH